MVLTRDSMTGGEAGLVMTFAVHLTASFNLAVRFVCGGEMVKCIDAKSVAKSLAETLAKSYTKMTSDLVFKDK